MGCFPPAVNDDTSNGSFLVQRRKREREREREFERERERESMAHASSQRLVFVLNCFLSRCTYDIIIDMETYIYE
jgi:hypothetical protein